jgi:phage terminase large subunit GpA-like protein
MTTIAVHLRRSALAFLAGGLAALIEPAAPVMPSAWAAEHAVLPDGEHRGEKIDLVRTPHIIEPLDMLGPDSPVNEIAVMKSGQTAFTTMLLCSIGHRIDRAPCDMVVVLPTDSALKSYNSTKLMRFIEGTPVLGGDEDGKGGKVYPQTSRGNTGSTTYEKKYPRGALNLLLASSPADLRLLTYKVAYCDEVEEYSDDLDGQGDVIGLVARGQKSFIASGNWKRVYVSTPAVKQSSVIEPLFERGDQRRWHVKCPGCAARFVLEWNAPYDRATHGLKFNKEFPYKAEYVTQCCGTVIDSGQKEVIYRTGKWIATRPGPGRYPSYHFDDLSTPFSTWDAIARDFVQAGEDQAKLKRFNNITLGRTFEMKGDAPDHMLLMQRREPYKIGHIPPGPCCSRSRPTSKSAASMSRCWRMRRTSRPGRSSPTISTVPPSPSTTAPSSR